MVVCQGCGRNCGLDLCCPSCSEYERSSFFCSQECFAANWSEHSKLHAILKQQKRVHEQDKKEQKIRGIHAASNALNAIQELFSTTTISTNDDFKDHSQKNPMDKLIGPNSKFSKFKSGWIVLVILLFIVITVFAKINFLISELPERVVAKNRVVDTLAVQGGPVPGVLVSKSITDNSLRGISDEPSDVPKVDPVEIAQLKAELEKYKALAQTTVLPVNESVQAAFDGPGVVRREAVPSARLLQQFIGQVRRES